MEEMEATLVEQLRLVAVSLDLPLAQPLTRLRELEEGYAQLQDALALSAELQARLERRVGDFRFVAESAEQALRQTVETQRQDRADYEQRMKGMQDSLQRAARLQEKAVADRQAAELALADSRRDTTTAQRQVQTLEVRGVGRWRGSFTSVSCGAMEREMDQRTGDGLPCRLLPSALPAERGGVVEGGGEGPGVAVGRR